MGLTFRGDRAVPAATNTDLEGYLAGVVATVLTMPASEVDRRGRFMDLGLDSILGVALVERLNADLGVDLRPTVVFDHPTVADLARHLGALGAHRAATAGPHPFGITFHDGLIWTADVMGDRVSVIDPIAGRLVGQIPTGSHPYAVAFAAGRGFVTNQYDGSVTVFDADSHAVLATVAVGDYPEGISPLPDGSAVAVANWDSDTLIILDATDLTVTMTVDLPSGPRAFGVFTGPP